MQVVAKVSGCLAKPIPHGAFLFGLVLQALLTSTLPRLVSFLPIVAYCLLLAFQNSSGPAVKPAPQHVNLGRYHAEIAQQPAGFSDGSTKEGLVVFLIGVTTRKGRMAPAFMEISRRFQSIWKEAEADRKTSGYLGRTTPMGGTRPSSESTFTTISYWRDIESLHKFAFGPAHRSGWDWWNETHKEHPYLGIFHEVYVVDKGRWSNIYVDFPAFGLGQTAIGKDNLIGELSPLVEAKGSDWVELVQKVKNSA